MNAAKPWAYTLMILPSFTHRLIAAALFAVGVGAMAAEGGKTEAQAAAREAGKAKQGAARSSDLKTLIQEAGKQRDALIADHEALAKQLKEATAEQQAAIREKMEAQKKRFDEEMASLHRRIRDEQRKERAAAAGKSGKR